MEPKLQRRIQRYGWDRAAGHYEDGWRRQLKPAQNLLLEMLALRPGEHVLEVACGTGLVTLRVAEAVGPEGAVVGTDISDRMLDAAREATSDRGLTHVAFERRDAEALGPVDEQFDAALCALGLDYVPDPVVALREMHRALRPGGRAGAAVWGERRRIGWAQIFPIVDARVASDVCPLFFQLGTKDLLARSLDKVGFHDVALERLSATLHYDSGDEACGATFAGLPVALAYSRFDARTREDAHREYLASIEAYRIGDGYAVPVEFVVATGQKG